MLSREIYWMGFLGTVLLAAALGIAFIREPARQERATVELQTAQIVEGIDFYAENCVVCHGAAGEGLGTNPSLDNEGLREMDAEALFKVIERGRYGTQMAAYGMDEGGIFTDAQINSLVTLIHYTDWSLVSARVDALGLTPPDVVVELSEDTLASVAALPEGETLTNGLTTYMEDCASCHGTNGEGTTLAPALNDAALRQQYTDANLNRIITQGVPGTLMAGWHHALTPPDIEDLVVLIRRWEDIAAAGVERPTVEAAPLDMSPEAIATGGRLYGILCAQCHGAEGYGTPLAPALNNDLFLNDTPNTAIQQIIAMGVPETVMPAWAGRLSEADIAALTAYIRSWEANAPSIVE